jgi:excisionase family DNA binding protein
MAPTVSESRSGQGRQRPPRTSHEAPGSSAESKQVLTVSEAANFLGISRTLAYDLVAKEQLPAVRLGRRIVVPARALDALLAAATAKRA